MPSKCIADRHQRSRRNGSRRPRGQTEPAPWHSLQPDGDTAARWRHTRRIPVGTMRRRRAPANPTASPNRRRKPDGGMESARESRVRPSHTTAALRASRRGPKGASRPGPKAALRPSDLPTTRACLRHHTISRNAPHRTRAERLLDRRGPSTRRQRLTRSREEPERMMEPGPPTPTPSRTRPLPPARPDHDRPPWYHGSPRGRIEMRPDSSEIHLREGQHPPA